jgi:hypothetical protein
MIAEDGKRAARGKFRYPIDHPLGISTVADQIAQKDVVIDAATRGIRQASRQCFSVGMDVGKQRNNHCCVIPSRA